MRDIVKTSGPLENTPPPLTLESKQVILDTDTNNIFMNPMTLLKTKIKSKSMSKEDIDYIIEPNVIEKMRPNIKAVNIMFSDFSKFQSGVDDELEILSHSSTLNYITIDREGNSIIMNYKYDSTAKSILKFPYSAQITSPNGVLKGFKFWESSLGSFCLSSLYENNIHYHNNGYTSTSINSVKCIDYLINGILLDLRLIYSKNGESSLIGETLEITSILSNASS